VENITSYELLLSLSLASWTTCR